MTVPTNITETIVQTRQMLKDIPITIQNAGILWAEIWDRI